MLNGPSKDVLILGAAWHIGSSSASCPAAPGLISLPKAFYEEKIIDAAKVNQQRWIVESGQRLENVD